MNKLVKYVVLPFAGLVTTVGVITACDPTPAVSPSTPSVSVPAKPAPTDEQPKFTGGVFGSTLIVGNGPQEIPAGKYYTTGEGGGYWARLSGTDGTVDQIIANGNVSGPTTITVKDSDNAIQFSGSAIWTKK